MGEIFAPYKWEALFARWPDILAAFGTTVGISAGALVLALALGFVFSMLSVSRFKPLRAVSGNIDGGLTRRVYPDFAAFRCEEVEVLMTHIGGYPRRYDPRALEKIRAVRPKLFVAGHSHILRVVYDPVYDLLHVNPGAAGCFGIHKLRTAVRFTVDGDAMRDMEVGEWPRR